MFRQFTFLVMLGIGVAVSGCATIVHSGPRAVAVASTPPGAKVSIYDRSNTIVQSSVTPFVAQLSPKYSYFKGQNYRLVFEMPGYAKAEVKLQSSMSGWYIGNLLFGGVIGLLIVDPLTGAMYDLKPDNIQQTLTPSQAKIIRSGTGLMVILASQATEGERASMVRVN